MDRPKLENKRFGRQMGLVLVALSGLGFWRDWPYLVSVSLLTLGAVHLILAVIAPDLLTRLRSDLDPLEIAASLDLNIWGSSQLPLKVLEGGSVNPPEIARTTTRTVDDKVDNANKDIENNSDSSLLGLLGLGLANIVGTEIFGSGTGQ